MPETMIPTHPSVRPGDPWWKGAVVYQIYPRSFADANGDGVGDLPGIISKLDYLQALGVDVLWLSPICSSPQDDNGYDIRNYQDIDPIFGTLADYDRLLKEAHARNMRVVMDLVLNHSSDEHPWFIESRSSADNPKRDWYYWRPARPGHQPGTPGAEPNNWESMFSGSAWSYDPATQQYYLHLFSRKQPDLNWENPALRNAIYDMINWWLDRVVDGFRMDVINFISKVPGLPDGDQAPGDPFGNGAPLFMNGPRIHEFLQEFHQRVFTGRETLITVGEMPGVSVDDAILYTDPARQEVDMVFQFEHMEVDRAGSKIAPQPLDLPQLKRVFAHWQTGLMETGWNSLYWNNHDQPRVVSRFGDDGDHRVASAKMLGAGLHLMKGTPYIYQGEEIGMTNYPWRSLDEFQDVEARNYVASHEHDPGYDADTVLRGLAAQGRDNARTPMQWDNTAQGGFTSGTPWLPVNPNTVTINVDAAVADRESVFAWYQRLIDLRHKLPIVVYGDFELLMPDDPRVFAYVRRLDGQRLVVLANVAASAADVTLPEETSVTGAELVLCNMDEPVGDAVATLRPWEVRVYLSDGADRQ